MIKCVFFDFDGTLVDSLWIWKQVDIEFLNKYNKKVPENLSEEIKALSFNQAAIYFQNKFKLKLSIDEIINEWIDMSYHTYDNVVLFEGAISLLDFLKNNNIIINLFTANKKEIVEKTLNRLKINEYFNNKFYDLDKNNIDVYTYFSKKININPENILLIDDAIVPLQTAKASGMKTAGIFTQEEKYIDFIIKDSLEEIIDFCFKKRKVLQ